MKELFKELLRAHMEPNIVTYNTILRVWADEADAGKAVPLLYHLLKPQVGCTRTLTPSIKAEAMRGAFCQNKANHSCQVDLALSC